MGMSRECVRFSNNGNSSAPTAVGASSHEDASSSDHDYLPVVEGEANVINCSKPFVDVVVSSGDGGGVLAEVDVGVETYDLILTVAQVHEISCAYTKLKRAVKCEIDADRKVLNAAGEVPGSDRERIQLWHQFAALLTADLTSVVEFAKRIPSEYL